MAMTLASGSGSDAEITDGIGRGDLGSAALLWVRHWPTALTAAAQYVEYREVPGLAAEALIGTVSLVATGRGPREDVDGFVIEAVRELGDDGAAPIVATEQVPVVFTSPRMSAAFDELSGDDQLALRAGLGHAATRALTVLQTTYLTTHLGDAPTRECRPPHIAMIAVADDSQPDAFGSHHWLHLSSCAWCTEAFHELAFSSVALEELVGPAPVLPAVAVEPVVESVPDEADEAPVQHRRRRAVFSETRYRVLAATALTAAAAVVVLVVGQNLASDDDPTPTAATGSTSRPSAPAPTDTVTGSAVAPPATSALVDPPTKAAKSRVPSPSDSPTGEAPSTPASSATAKPTKSATHESPSSSPTRTPTKTPTATPTKSCNPLQHLLGFC